MYKYFILKYFSFGDICIKWKFYFNLMMLDVLRNLGYGFYKRGLIVYEIYFMKN